MLTLLLGVVVFMSVILALSLALSWAQVKLLGAGTISIRINDDPALSFEHRAGGTLLQALGAHGIRLPSSCGGRGTCGTCKVRVRAGGGPLLPTERGFIRRSEERDGIRLACQLKVRETLSVEIPREILLAHEIVCRVRSNRSVATFIKELVLELPDGETLEGFRPGGYIQARIPPHSMSYRSIEIEPRFREAWNRADLWGLTSNVEADEDVQRAYSLANIPSDDRLVVLNVRIALPPPDSGAPPGKASSYLFGLKEGDHLAISGPFGSFVINETDAEMVYIGGGAGMAPLRSQLIELLHRRNTTRKISYWYGARSLLEAFYLEELEALEKTHPNFEFHLALSSPQTEDDWHGAVGFIHQVVFEGYLQDHHAPETIEYYVCGPPMMLHCCLQMLEEIGVPNEQIFYDEL